MHPSSQYLMRPVKSVKDPLGILALKFDCYAADGDAILAGAASASTEQTLTADDFVSADAIGKPGSFVTFAFSTHADWDATTALFTGQDAAGRIISEEISILNGGNVLRATAKRYVRPISLYIPAQSGAGGTVDVGWANRVEGEDIPIPVGITIPPDFSSIEVDLKVPEDLVRAVFLHVQETGVTPSYGATLFSPKWSFSGSTIRVWSIFHDTNETDDPAVAALGGHTISLMVAFDG